MGCAEIVMVVLRLALHSALHRQGNKRFPAPGHFYVQRPDDLIACRSGE
jgi:hypothetical protein